MLHIQMNNELEQLRQMSEHFDAQFTAHFNSARLDFDNEHGKGYIASYQMFPGLVAKTYNVHLTQELRFTKKEEGTSPTYFIYCVKGYYFHRFLKDASMSRINRNQNVILGGGKTEGHEVILPAEIDLQISILFLNADKLEFQTNKKAGMLEEVMQRLASSFEVDKVDKYFGEIDPDTANFARVLIENKRVDTLGVIITEGAILNTLASQLSNHEKNRNAVRHEQITRKELSGLIDLGDYIRKNLHRKINIEELAKESGIYPKKLQEGFKYLYGETVANLIQRLRLERARQLLQSTDLSISEVCYRVGVSSRSHFSKLFFEHFGALPSEYRTTIERSGHIFELCYQSTAKPQISDADLLSILKNSLEHNKAKNITGALLFYKGQFFQLIEGNKSEILELFESIRDDERHHSIKLAYTGQKLDRTFKDWSMAFLGEEDGIGAEKFDGLISFVNFDSILSGLEESEMFSDLLWRRVSKILQAKEL